MIMTLLADLEHSERDPDLLKMQRPLKNVSLILNHISSLEGAVSDVRVFWQPVEVAVFTMQDTLAALCFEVNAKNSIFIK